MVCARRRRKEGSKGNDNEGKVAGSPGDRTGEPGKTGSVEEGNESGRTGMTFKAMGCDPEETARRQAVCVRLNTLWTKRTRTDDEHKRKQIDRRIAVILRQERPWMKEAAYFLY